MILLCGLDLKSPLFFLLLPIRAYFELILRRSWSCYVEAQRSFEAAAAWICRDSAGSLFGRGVMNFSGLNFGGCVISSNIGYRPKKDFLSSHVESMSSGSKLEDMEFNFHSGGWKESFHRQFLSR